MMFKRYAHPIKGGILTPAAEQARRQFIAERAHARLLLASLDPYSRVQFESEWAAEAARQARGAR